MPIYEFKCSKCGNVLEIKASVEEKQKGLKLVCSKCGSKEFKQMFNSICVLGGSNDASENISPTSCGCNGCCG